MFTLTRVVAGLLLMLFMMWIAPTYAQIYDPERPMPGLAGVLGTTGFIAGWSFLGNRTWKLWYSLYLGVQAVALAGIFAAVPAAVRDVFSMGYRRRFDDASEAVMAIPQFAWDYLWRAFERDFLITLVAGGLVLGLVVHVIDKALDRRRLAR